MPAGRGHYTGDGQRCDCLWRGPFRPIRAAAADSEPVPHLRADGGVHPFSCFVCERCFGLLDAQVSYTICAAFPSNSHTHVTMCPCSSATFGAEVRILQCLPSKMYRPTDEGDSKEGTTTTTTTPTTMTTTTSRWGPWEELPTVAAGRNLMKVHLPGISNLGVLRIVQPKVCHSLVDAVVFFIPASPGSAAGTISVWMCAHRPDQQSAVRRLQVQPSTPRVLRLHPKKPPSATPPGQLFYTADHILRHRHR
jgi:hypothetical protein